MSLREYWEFDSLYWRLPAGPRRFIVLVRHFFTRFFQNDVFPFEDQMKEKLYILLAMVATLGWFLTSSLFNMYIFVPDQGESWLQKCELISFFMLLLVLLTLLEWDVLFLDRRDFVNLAGLPIRPGTLFRAKFVSFLFFVALFSFAVNALSVVAIGFYLPQWIGNSLGCLVRYMIAHFLSMTAALFFAFFLVLSLKAVLLFFLGPRSFRIASLAVRFILSIGCVAFILTFFFNSNYLEHQFEGLGDLRSRDPAAALAVPSLWFTGIYEVLIGRGNPINDAAAFRGMAATLALGLFAFFSLAWSYRKHMRKSLEIRTRRRPFHRIGERILILFDGFVLRNPIQRAVFHFFGTTLRNSPRLKVRLAGSLAIALGFQLVLLSPVTRLTPGFQLPASPEASSLYFLHAPLILAIALLIGLRTGVNIPLSAEANWIFRLTESPVRRPYFSALKKAVLIFALLPLFFVLFIGHAFLWGPGPAALHSLFGFICALFFREILFWRYAKIPFSCLVVPGKAQIQKYWLLYFLAFILTITILSLAERALFRHPSLFPVFFGISAAVLAGGLLLQRLFIYEKLNFIYEEVPEPVMVTL